MKKYLRKRLEEAAKKYIRIITPDDIPYYHKDVKQGFLAGAEFGYKEAIAQAKAWLEKENATLSTCFNFESEMLKLWEDKK